MSSSQQNPFLLPPVLDILFPYLTFPELKSSRLVCSIWDAIALPLIGSKKLKPINFSQISYEDFLALKLEFEDDRMRYLKLKLFQGFTLNWEQVSTMAYCNFLASFLPNEVIISGDNVHNPSNSLKMLLSPIAATLNHLHLEIIWDIMPLFNLGSIAGIGMRLKSLHLDVSQHNYFRRADTPILFGLSDFLWSQASALEKLFLKIVCEFEEGYVIDEASQIELPVFPHITSLSSLSLSYSGYHYLFKPFVLIEKFPQYFSDIESDPNLKVLLFN